MTTTIKIRKDKWTIQLETLMQHLNADEFEFRRTRFPLFHGGEVIINKIYPGDDRQLLLKVIPDVINPENILVISSYPPKELAFELLQLPKNIINEIKTLLKDSALEISELTDEEYAEFSKNKNDRTSMWFHYKNMADEANNTELLHDDANPLLSNENFQYAHQGTLVMASKDNEKHILVSEGAYPCYILAVHNPEHNIGFLTHIDYDTDIASLDKYFNIVCSDASITNVHLVGGLNDSIVQAGQLIEKIKNDTRMQLTTCCLLNDSARQMALDTTTGKIYFTFTLDKLESKIGEEYAELLSRPAPRALVNISTEKLKVSDKNIQTIAKMRDDPIFGSARSSNKKKSSETSGSNPSPRNRKNT